MFGFSNRMKASEIEISRLFMDKYDLQIIINANKNKWEIVWADSGTDSKPTELNDTLANIEDAKTYLASIGFKDLKAVVYSPKGER